MKKLILLCLILLGSIECFAQYSYSAFDGKRYNMRTVEKKNIVLLVPTDHAISNEIALDTIAERADHMYEYYKKTMGFEPYGGMPTFSNKASVAFVTETCGAACGLIGSKGIEIGVAFLNGMIDNVLQTKRGNHVGLISYEFGRNFYTSLVQTKLGFKTDGGVMANGFATFLGLEAEAYAKANEIEKGVIGKPWFRNLLYGGTLGYLVNPKMNAEDFFFIKEFYVPDFNRAYGPTYAGGSFLNFLDSVLTSKNLFPGFWQHLNNQPNATSDQDVLDNIAVATSLAVGENLTNFFNDVLKFHLTSSAISKISQLSNPKDFRLIRDIKYYDICNLNEDITLLTACLAHKSSDLYYAVKVTLNNKVIFETKTVGSNVILPISDCFSICDSSEDRIATIYSIVKNIPVDSIKVCLHYRDNINTNEHLERIVESSYFTAYNKTGYSTYNLSNNTIRIHSTGKLLDDMGIGFPFRPIKDRTYQMKGLIKTSGKGKGFIVYGGGLGGYQSDYITTKDTMSYFPVEITFNTNGLDTSLFNSERAHEWISLNLDNDSVNEPQFAEYKDVVIIDVTASDVQWNKKPGKPIISVSGQQLLSDQSTGNQWFLNGNEISGANKQAYEPQVSGIYTVVATTETCVSEFSDPFNFFMAGVESGELSEKILIYPNPNKGEFTAAVPSATKKVQIYSVEGSLVQEILNLNNNEIIRCKLPQCGIYILKIYCPEQIISKKVVIQNP